MVSSILLNVGVTVTLLDGIVNVYLLSPLSVTVRVFPLLSVTISLSSL